MKIQEIKSAQDNLLRNTDRETVVTVSQVAKFFIPDWATGSKKAKDKGTDRHEEVEEEAEVITRDEMWSNIETGEAIFPEFFIRAEAPVDQEIVLSGKVDMVYFRDQKPVFILERKFPNPKNINKVYESEKIQAFTYALMLDEAGFDTSELSYAVLKMDRETPRKARQAFDARILQAAKKDALDQVKEADSNFEYDSNLFLKNYERTGSIDRFKEALKAQLSQSTK